MTRSAFLVRDAAHDRPFSRIAVATAAENHDQLSGRIRAQRLDRLLQGVGLMRVIDEDRRAVALSGKLKTAFRAGESLQCREYTRRHGAGRDGKTAATAALCTWKPPTSGSLTL